MVSQMKLFNLNNIAIYIAGGKYKGTHLRVRYVLRASLLSLSVFSLSPISLSLSLRLLQSRLMS